MSLATFPGVLGRSPTASSLGIGDVDGPSSATDNAIARFDGTTGKIIQNSVLIVADTTGALSGFTTGVGITFHEGGTLTGASGGLTLTASGTNQSITLTPSGTGSVAAGTYFAPTASQIGAAGSRWLATNGSTTGWGMNIPTGGLIQFTENNVAAVNMSIAGIVATGSVTGTFYVGSTQALSGAGAANVTTETTKITTTGAGDAITLADGTNGQTKTIIHDVDGGSFVLTPTTKTGWSTFTSTAAGESITLRFVTTRGWIVIGSYLGVIAP